MCLVDFPPGNLSSTCIPDIPQIPVPGLYTKQLQTVSFHCSANLQQAICSAYPQPPSSLELRKLKGKPPSAPEGPPSAAPLATACGKICRSLEPLQSCLCQQHLRISTRFWDVLFFNHKAIHFLVSLYLTVFNVLVQQTVDLDRLLYNKVNPIPN